MKLEISAILFFVAVASAGHNLIVRRDTLDEKAKNLLLVIKDIVFLEPYINDAYDCDKTQMDKVKAVVLHFSRVPLVMYDSNGNLRVTEKYLDDATKNAEDILKTFMKISTLKGFDKHSVGKAADYVASLMKNGVRAKILPKVANLISETDRAKSVMSVITALQFLLPHYYKKQNCDQEIRKLYKYIHDTRKVFETKLKDSSVTHADVDKHKAKIDEIVNMLQSALG